MSRPISLIFVTILFLVFILWGLGFGAQKEESELELSFKPEKNTFLLGEAIPITIQLKNIGTQELALANTIDPIHGSLQISAQSVDETVHLKFRNPRWGIMESNGIVWIAPNETISNNSQILSRTISNDSSEYFFGKEGEYFIKVSYLVQIAGTEGLVPIESDPVRVRFVAPTGQDIEVWNKLKSLNGVAYFTQEGEIMIPKYRKKDRTNFIQYVEKIVLDYPESVYSKDLIKALDNFRRIND